MLNGIGIKIMLTGGQFLVLVLPEAEATDIMRRYKSREFAIKGDKMLHGVMRLPGKPQLEWAICWEEVIAMHTFDPIEQAVVQQQQAPVGPHYFPGSSGLPN